MPLRPLSAVTHVNYSNHWMKIRNIMSEQLITILVKKPTKKENNYYFNIPIEFINSRKIKPDQNYEIKIFTIPQE